MLGQGYPLLRQVKFWFRRMLSHGDARCYEAHGNHRRSTQRLQHDCPHDKLNVDLQHADRIPTEHSKLGALRAQADLLHGICRSHFVKARVS